MTRFALLLTALAATPALAQNTSDDAGLYVTILPEPRLRDGAIGEVVHHNRITSGRVGQDFYEFETSRGTVVLRLTTTQNSLCAAACPDTVEVWSLPAGIVAVPGDVETPERGVGIITLFEWTGM